MREDSVGKATFQWDNKTQWSDTCWWQVSTTKTRVTVGQVTKEVTSWRRVKIVRKTSKEWTESAWGWTMRHSEWAISPLAGLNEEMGFKSRINSTLQ